MKRSNRLVLLIGVFLAIVAFVGILLLNGSNGSNGNNNQPTQGQVVVAVNDLALSTKIQATDVTTKTLPLTAINAGAFSDVSQVVGKIVRAPVTAGAQLTSDTFASGGAILDVNVPAGRRAIAVQVDQVSGVGTVIKTGDYVDLIAGITGDKFPVVTTNPADRTLTVVSGINGDSVKVILQGLQVLGTLLPPASTSTGQQQPANGQGGTGSGSTTALNGQQEIVILSVDAQQAEVVKFAQMDSQISLVLRAADDFIDPTTNQPVAPLPVNTTGIILKSLVDRYGVLPPELVETVTPKP